MFYKIQIRKVTSFKINLKKVKGADTNLRTIIELPNGSGKKFKVAVLCDENKLDDAKKSGAEIESLNAWKIVRMDKESINQFLNT